MVMDAIRLAGITPTSAGYRIAPHIPFQPFTLRLPQIGIAAGAHQLVGYLQPEQAGMIELQVRLPHGLIPRAIATWANGATVAHTLQDGLVVFSVPTAVDSATDWAVTW
jgi:hypothetical protein